jgi:hypothetical protein
MESKINFANVDEFLAQNDFVALAKAIKQPENRTNTSIRIDLSSGECWVDMEGIGESHVYDSDTVIIMLWQSWIPYKMRNARNIESIAKRVMQMYAGGVPAEGIEFHNLERVKDLDFGNEGER